MIAVFLYGSHTLLHSLAERMMLCGSIEIKLKLTLNYTHHL